MKGSKTMFEKSVSCEHCNKTYVLNINETGWKEWESGEFIQDALPDLEAGERELLISGTCHECWKKFFGDRDDLLHVY